MSTGERHESRQGPQKSHEEPGEAASSGPGQTGQAPGPAAATQADSAADESLTPFVGYRGWEIRKGHLMSLGSTVWPVDLAVEAQNNRTSLATFFAFVLVLLMTMSVSLLAVIGVKDQGLAFLAAGSGVAYLSLEIADFFRTKRYSALEPGNRTPGLYAMKRAEDVVGRRILRNHAIVVRGSVYLWGDTIEHDHGVKGQYGYPAVLTDVSCVRCVRWMPIDLYDDRLGPPVHLLCPSPRHRLDRCVQWFGVLQLPYLRKVWQPCGLSGLRERAPLWFRR